MITAEYMSKTNETKVTNQENVKVAIEEARELSTRERVSAYLANHATEHYCAATGEDSNNISSILENCKKEDGVYWLYTSPAIGGTRKDGKPNPTREEWEKLNNGAVRVANIAGKQWYKKAYTIDDACGVLTVVNGYNRYNEAKDGAKKKVANMAEIGKVAFATMTKEQQAAYIAELQAMLAK